MNNGASINSVTINGWRGDTSVRIQVLAFGRAVVVATGHVLRRSVVMSQALAAGTKGGRVWRRSPVAAQALAAPVAVLRIWRRVFSPVVATASAVAVNLGHILVLTPVRVLVAGLARAVITGIGGRVFARSVLSSQARAIATVTPHLRKRLIVPGQARAVAVVAINIDRFTPWDEPAPESRTFIVPAGTHFFTVVS